MRRVMLFVLLAVVLPTAALASSIDFSSGPLATPPGSVSGLNVSGGISGSFTVRVNGTMHIMFIQGTALGPGCASGAAGATCTFTPSGMGIRVLNSTGSTTLFSDSMYIGTITFTSPGHAVFEANLAINSGTPSLGPSGGLARFVVSFNPNGSLTSGTARVAALPEPGTLGMLGTGLIGLAGMARRKLKHSK